MKLVNKFSETCTIFINSNGLTQNIFKRCSNKDEPFEVHIEISRERIIIKLIHKICSRVFIDLKDIKRTVF